MDFRVGDFNALPFDDGAFDAVVSSHALLFADDRVAALREWRRICRPGGRLSLSVPGPEERTPGPLYAEVYLRHGVPRTFGLPGRRRACRLGARCRMDRCGRRRRSNRRHSPARCGGLRHLAQHRLSWSRDGRLERGAARGPDRGHAGGYPTTARRRLRHPVRGVLPHRAELTPQAGRAGRPSRRVRGRPARRPASGRPRDRRRLPSPPRGRASDLRPPAARRPARRPVVVDLGVVLQPETAHAGPSVQLAAQHPRAFGVCAGGGVAVLQQPDIGRDVDPDPPVLLVERHVGGVFGGPQLTQVSLHDRPGATQVVPFTDLHGQKDSRGATCRGTAPLPSARLVQHDCYAHVQHDCCAHAQHDCRADVQHD